MPPKPPLAPASWVSPCQKVYVPSTSSGEESTSWLKPFTGAQEGTAPPSSLFRLYSWPLSCLSAKEKAT